MDSRDVIRVLESDGWRLVRVTGSHHHFRHSECLGTVTVAHPRKDLPPKTVRSVERQSGCKFRMSMDAFYPAIIERASDGFGVFFPDVPGCTSAGDTVEDAARNAADALAAHLAIGIEHGEMPPQPSDLAAIASDPETDEVSRILVRFDAPATRLAAHA